MWRGPFGRLQAGRQPGRRTAAAGCRLVSREYGKPSTGGSGSPLPKGERGAKHYNTRMKTVIFDFGNVVGFFDHWKTLERLAAHTDMPGREMFETVYLGQFEEDFESGKINERQFVEHFLERCRLKCDAAFLTQSVADIFEPNPEVCDLIEQLHGKVRLVLGSNTNPVHAAHFVKQFDSVLRRFDALVMSHQVGARKPRAEFFAACHRHAEGRPEECVFIDDLPANITGAEAFGFRGILYRPGEDLADKLREVGVVI